MDTFQSVHEALLALANTKKAQLLQGFFRTGKGEYGEGDQFLGITVPAQRLVAKQFKLLPRPEITKLLRSPIHEERLVALVILQLQFDASDEVGKQTIVDFYLNNTDRINNWDLVDISADKILGKFLLNRPRDVLYRLAQSSVLWEKRIAIVATYTFIRAQQFDDTIAICELLLTDKHDLIHKACGWMLREVGKRNQEVLKVFLARHAVSMPRTMLRYSIEKFSSEVRAFYLEAKRNKD